MGQGAAPERNGRWEEFPEGIRQPPGVHATRLREPCQSIMTLTGAPEPWSAVADRRNGADHVSRST